MNAPVEKKLTLESQTWEKVTVSVLLLDEQCSGEQFSDKQLFTYNFKTQSFEKSSPLPPIVLQSAGLSLPLNKEEIQEKIFTLVGDSLSRNNHKILGPKNVLCVALDTNAILTNTYYHLISDTNSDRVRPFLLLLSQAIAHEFHYMQSFKITKKEKKCLKHFVQDSPHVKPLFPKHLNWQLILNEKGRRGLMGMAKFEQLARKHTIITRSHGHLFYSAPAVSKLENTKPIGLDSVFDTLIQTEIELFQATTNAKILFLSGDQFLVNMFNTLGIDAIQLKYAQSPRLPDQISNADFHKVLTELLVPFPLIKLSVQNISGKQQTFFLTYANETIGKRNQGRNVFVISQKNTQPWLWDLRFD